MRHAEEIKRLSAFHDIASYLEDNSTDIFEETWHVTGASLSGVRFSTGKILKSVGVAATLHFRSKGIQPEYLMAALASCGIYCASVIHPNYQSATVLMRFDEWSALSMHLRLLGHEDGEIETE